jgi:hypothetical protein
MLWKAEKSAEPHIRITIPILLYALLGLTGCGGGSTDLPTGRVSGKVSHNGQPVTGGTVTFAPLKSGVAGGGMVGKPASGPISSDGSFSLTTYSPGDGAVVGKHTVGYSAPAVEIDEAMHTENSKPPVSPYAGLVPKIKEVEVKPGSNTIDIELVPNPNAGAGGS